MHSQKQKQRQTSLSASLTAHLIPRDARKRSGLRTTKCRLDSDASGGLDESPSIGEACQLALRWHLFASLRLLTDEELPLHRQHSDRGEIRVTRQRTQGKRGQGVSSHRVGYQTWV